MISTFIHRKLIYELDNLWALCRYPMNKETLLERLEKSISTINIETTNICNANCIFCAYQHQERATGVMNCTLFEKIVNDYVALGGGPLSLTPTVGDPLVDKHLLRRLAYARSKPEISSIGMYTNMILLDRFGAEALLRSGISWIVVSTSGLEETMYKRVYRSTMYNQMLKNVKLFAEANRRAGNPVDFRVDMRIDRPLKVVLTYPDYKDVAAIVGEDHITAKFRYDDWSGSIKPEDLSGTMRHRKLGHFRLSPCSELYSGPMVYWNGAVGACGCRDVNASELMIGNVAEQDLGDIWFGGALKELRSAFMTDKIRPICASCTHYNNVSVWLTERNREQLARIEPAAYVRQPALGGAVFPGHGGNGISQS